MYARMSRAIFYNVRMDVRRTDASDEQGPAAARGDATHVYRGDLGRLTRKINSERGLDLSQYRPQYLERRIATRLRALGLHSYRQYADYLSANEDEYPLLLNTLTINVTDFFRDATVFDAFRNDVVPALIAEKSARKQRLIRAWSAGCATGEETYSIAMSLVDALRESRSEFMVTVTGTDLDEKALEEARRGTYVLEKLKNIPQAFQVEYLDVQDETFQIRPEVARRVKFRRLNLFSDKPISVVDVIFCRNVFIYFNREQQASILEKFWNSLARGGYLVLGRSEKMAQPLAQRFQLVNARERIYRKPAEQ